MIGHFLILLTLILFPALMAFSASSDIFSMKISNRVSIALAALYPVLAIALGVPTTAILIDLACGAVVLILTFLMFARGWIAFAGFTKWMKVVPSDAVEKLPGQARTPDSSICLRYRTE